MCWAHLPSHEGPEGLAFIAAFDNHKWHFIRSELSSVLGGPWPPRSLSNVPTSLPSGASRLPPALRTLLFPPALGRFPRGTVLGTVTDAGVSSRPQGRCHLA